MGKKENLNDKELSEENKKLKEQLALLQKQMKVFSTLLC
jgi:hypothetical protein